MVVRPLHPETLTMAPQVRGARGEELVEIALEEEEEGGIREEVEGDTEEETLVISSSSSKAIDRVSFTIHLDQGLIVTLLLIYQSCFRWSHWAWS